jgi:hypothetical protein
MASGWCAKASRRPKNWFASHASSVPQTLSGACGWPGSSTGTVRRPGSSCEGGALGFGSPGWGSGLFSGGTDSGAGTSGMVQPLRDERAACGTPDSSERVAMLDLPILRALQGGNRLAARELLSPQSYLLMDALFHLGKSLGRRSCEFSH